MPIEVRSALDRWMTDSILPCDLVILCGWFTCLYSDDMTMTLADVGWNHG